MLKAVLINSACEVLYDVAAASSSANQISPAPDASFT